MAQREFNKLSHTIYKCVYHIVFCPKYRKKVLQDDIAEYIKQQLYILSRQKDLVEIIELNVQHDHVHLIVSIPPKYSVSTFVGFLKGKIALKLFQ